LAPRPLDDLGKPARDRAEEPVAGIDDPFEEYWLGRRTGLGAGNAQGLSAGQSAHRRPGRSAAQPIIPRTRSSIPATGSSGTVRARACPDRREGGDQWGLPNGYILGQEAGGAVVAGLRYGEGTLYTKNAGESAVFWQGPSVGFDFGGEGARTMMLV